MPYPPCTVTNNWLKYQDPARCLRRVTQPPHIAGPLPNIRYKIRHMRKEFITIATLFIAINAGFSQKELNNKSAFSNLIGTYFGQKPPESYPVLFAPEIMNAEQGYHFPIIFSPDLTEAFWKPMEIGNTGLLYSQMIDEKWTTPLRINFSFEKGIGDACFSPDGNKLFFLSFQGQHAGDIERERIWFVERNSSGWSKPTLIDEVINSHPTHWKFSLATNGNLYFTSEIKGVQGEQDIYVAYFVDGKYHSPISVGHAINTDAKEFGAFIAPDESYLIFTRIGDKTEKTDLFISFKNQDGNWTKAINMGPKINSPSHDMIATVSYDGKYLFFISQRERMNGIYWVNTKIIDELKPQEIR